MTKKLIKIILVSSLLLNYVSVFAVEPKDLLDEVSIAVDEEIDEETNVEDLVIDDVDVELNNREKKKEIIMYLGSSSVTIDGVEEKLLAPPKLINNTTYLPIRFIGDRVLEAVVDWDGTDQIVTISNSEVLAKLKVGANEAIINDNKVEIANSPVLEKDATYLPLRTVADIFDIHTDYNHNTKCITLTKIKKIEEEKVEKPPIADFEFEEKEYTEGQTVKALDKSYDQEEGIITNRLWMVNNNEKNASSKLENIFSKPKMGIYLVSLKVKNEKGIWSEWTSKQITINQNLKPVITDLSTGKSSYRGGEALSFTYQYDNEPWEDIIATRWTYREINEPITKAVVEKPKFIFHEGQYVVTLQLQDENKNWSDRKETIVNIKGKADISELEYRFTQGEIGDIIDNYEDFNYRNYKPIKLDKFVHGGGKLLMSDSPEVVKDDGILYRDTVNGLGRILVHHENGYSDEINSLDRKRLVIVAENPTDEPVVFKIKNQVVKGPNQDTLYVGQQLLYDFLKGNAGKDKGYVLKPGEKAYIYDSGKSKWGKGDIVSGVMDFDAYGPIIVTVASFGQNMPINSIDFLPELSKDRHPRGTFDSTDIYYKINLEDDEPTKLLLGNGTEEWLNGYDAITGELVQNRGNYGVTYSITITAKEDTGIILNPRAGEFRGAVKWDGKETYLAPSKGYISGHNSKAIMIGVIKAGETKTLEYVLPNGSASPVLLGFIPKDYWK